MKDENIIRMVTDTLLATRDMLDEPKAWTQKASARDFQGNPVHATAEEAVSHDLFGAIVVSAESHKARELTLMFLLDCVPEMSKGLTWFNDNHTKDVVLCAIERVTDNLQGRAKIHAHYKDDIIALYKTLRKGDYKKGGKHSFYISYVFYPPWKRLWITLKSKILRGKF